MSLTIRISPITIILLLLVNMVCAQEQFAFKDNKLNIDLRVEDLLNRLSTDEKISLLTYDNPEIQRLGITSYNWWNESLHGVGRAGLASVFPQNIALAASFDTILIYRIATAIADEARVKHNLFKKRNITQAYTGLTFWSPNVNIFRDPRWGRGQETFGEDPYLTGLMGRNYVKGMQGKHEHYLKTACCAKHFAVHSGPEKSRHSFNAKPSEFDLFDTYLPAFKMLADARVEAFMCAYNQLFDQPCCANEYLLHDILKTKWNFQGHIVSDCWAISDFVDFQNYSENKVVAASQAMLAGVNLNCGSSYKHLREALELKLIKEEDIDKALIPLLKTQLKLGMFDEPGNNPFDTLSVNTLHCQKHIDLAYEAATKSIVLLSNKNETLPLNINEIEKLFISGPLAGDITALLGNYNGLSNNMVTPLEGIINTVGEKAVIDYTLGTPLANSDHYNGIWQAGNADAIIVFLGNNRLLEGEDGDALLNDFGGDRISLSLPENQLELLRKLRQGTENKKIIVVISGGSAVDCKEICDLADAVLFNWYSGEQGGNAIADVLFGIKNPSGRLPVTFYKHSSDLPPFDNYSMKNRTYRYFKGEVLFPFGFGLSYSEFEYRALSVECSPTKSHILVSGKITNNSLFSGTEIIQVYAKPFKPIRGVSLNNKLVSFTPVFIEAGETKSFEFEIPQENFSLYNPDSGNYELFEGETVVQVAKNSKQFIEEFSIYINGKK